MARGTDTGVGKTLVSSAIIRLLLKQNQAVFAAKPLATGSEKQPDGTLRHGDVAQMAEALGGKPVWVGFESPHPAAPSVAARWEGKKLDLMQMAKDLKFAIPAGHFAVVEGAGGLLCPAGPGISIADLAEELGFPVLLVAKNCLGVLNHTLLALEVARGRGLEVLGIILNQLTAPGDRVEAENAAELARLAQVPILLEVPFGDLYGISLEKSQLSNILLTETDRFMG